MEEEKKVYDAPTIKSILKELEITPINGTMVDTQQVALILTWRLVNEYKVDQTYTDTAVRRRVNSNSLKVTRRINVRFNLFDIKEVFNLPLTPARARGAKARKPRMQKPKPISSMQ